MSWITNSNTLFSKRKTKYCNAVGLRAKDVNKMVDNFDGLFDLFTNFTDEISSLKYYPFKFMCKDIDSWKLMSTLKGFADDVFCIDLDDKYCYLNMDGSTGGYVITSGYNGSMAFANYKGYVTIKCFLPCVGYVEIDPNECVGKVLHFRLAVDYYTGKGMYLIGVSDNYIFYDTPFADYTFDKDIRIISTYECDIGVTIPLGQSNTSDLARNLALSGVKAITGAFSSFYKMSLPSAVTTNINTTDWEVSSRLPYKGSRMRISEKGTETTVNKKIHNKPIDKLSHLSDTISATADALNRSYPTSNSDRVNDTGLMRYMSGKIHVIVYRPKFLKSDYSNLYGYPYNSVTNLANVYGYTEISSAHFEGSAFKEMTSNERGILEQIMADGVILPDPPSTSVTSTDTTEE